MAQYHPTDAAGTLFIKRNSISRISYLSACILSMMFGAVPAHAANDSSNDSPQENSSDIVQLPRIFASGQNQQKDHGSQTIISQDQLEKSGATDMASIVKDQPLVSAPGVLAGSSGSSIWHSSGTTSYNIRGVDGNRVGLDVDGVDIAEATPSPDSSKAQSFGFGRDYIDPEMFRTVHISEGATDVDSNGLGGRVSFRTKSPEDYLKDGKNYYVGLKRGYSSADSAYQYAVTAAAGNDVVKGLVVYSHRDGEQTKTKGNLAANSDDWRSDAVLSKLLWNTSENNQLTFTFDYYQKEDTQFIDYDTLKSGGTSSYTSGLYQKATAKRTRFSLDDIWHANNSLFDVLKTSIYYQNSESLTHTYGQYSTRGLRNVWFGFYNSDYGIKLQADKNIGRHAITYGVTYSELDQKMPWTSNYGTTTSLANYMPKTNTQKATAYISDAIKFDVNGHLLTITPGVRAEYQQANPKDTDNYLTDSAYASLKSSQLETTHDHAISPQIAMSYQLAPNYLTYVQYNNGHRLPTAMERTGVYGASGYGYTYAIAGNPNLKTETSHGVEWGLKSKPAQGLTLNASVFYTHYKNFIDYVSTTPPSSNYSLYYEMENLAQANIWGGELSTRLDLGAYVDQAQGYSIALAAGKSKGNAKDQDGSKGSINSIQPGKASLTLAYDNPNKLFGLNVTTTTVESKQASSNDTSSQTYSSSSTYYKAPTYTVLDLGGYWNVNQYLKLNLALNNVFDKKYWDYSTVSAFTTSQTTLIDRATATGRNVVLSAEFKF